MPMEYQHFTLKHVKTGEPVNIKIGPVPIEMQDFGLLLRDEFEKRGMRWSDCWNIDKAWVAP